MGDKMGKGDKADDPRTIHSPRVNTFAVAVMGYRVAASKAIA